MTRRHLTGLALAGVLAWAGSCSDRSERADRPRPVRRLPAEEARPKPPPRLPPGADDLPNLVEGAFENVQSTRPAAPALVKGPWADAREGQFAAYRGAGGLTLRYKVVSVGQEAVTVETTASGGQGEAQQTVALPRMVSPDQAAHGIPATANWSQEALRVGGREVTCRVATWQKGVARRGRTCRMWLSNQVPGQVVRSAATDGNGNVTVTLDLVDFGG